MIKFQTYIVIFYLFSLNTFLFAQNKLLDSTELTHTKTFHNLESALENPLEVYKLDFDAYRIPHNPLSMFTLSDKIGKLKNLQVLKLSSNEFTILPKEIKELKNLTSLDLSNNKLTQFPEEILALKNLTYLDLSSNKINTLPKEINKLTNLQHLHLRHLGLTHLPKEISALKNLKSLSLNNHNFGNFAKEIKKLKNIKTLTHLSISKNIIIYKREISILKYLTHLELYITNDKITAEKVNDILSELSFLPSLINLTTNVLGTTSLKTLTKLRHLTVLNLLYNEIKNVPDEMKNLKALKFLDLENTDISEKELEKIKKLLPNCHIKR